MPNEYPNDIVINTKDMKHNVPEVATTNKNGVTQTNIYLMWDKLRMYGNQRYFSHNNYKEALKTLINDPNIFRNFKDKVHLPLKDILKSLTNLYVTGYTIADHNRELAEFTRGPGEPLQAALERLGMLLHRTEILYKPEQRATRTQISIDQALARISSPSAQKAVQRAKANAQRFASDISQQSLIDIAVEAELDNNDAPTTQLHGDIFVSAITAERERSRNPLKPQTPDAARRTSRSPAFQQALDNLRQTQQAKRDSSRDRSPDPRQTQNRPTNTSSSSQAYRPSTPRVTGSNTTRPRGYSPQDGNRSYSQDRQQSRRYNDDTRRKDDRFNNQNRSRGGFPRPQQQQRNPQQQQQCSNQMQQPQVIYAVPQQQAQPQAPQQQQPFQIPTPAWTTPSYGTQTQQTQPQLMSQPATQNQQNYQPVVNSFGNNQNRQQNQYQGNNQRQQNNQRQNYNQRPYQNKGYQGNRPRQQDSQYYQGQQQHYQQQFHYNQQEDQRTLSANYKPSGSFQQEIHFHGQKDQPLPIQHEGSNQQQNRQPRRRQEQNMEEQRGLGECIYCHSSHIHDFKLCRPQGNQQR